MDTYELPEGYQIRLDITPHDDRGFKDEWQDEVYREARLVFNEYWCKSVVDYGCGSAFKLRKHFKGLEYAGVEIEPCLSFLRKEYPHDHWITPEEFHGMHADLIVCADVIEHVENPDLLLENLSASDCPVIISTPDRNRIQDQSKDGPPKNTGHIREWTSLQFARLVGRYFDVRHHGHCSDHPECQWILALP